MTIEVSNSEITMFKRCKRKWWLSYVLRLRPKAREVVGPLPLGSRVHKALEVHYRDGVPLLEAHQKLVDEARVEIAMEGLLDDGKLDEEAELGRIMLEGYLEWVAEEGLDSDLELLDVEQVLKYEFPLSRGAITLMGKIDQRVFKKFTGTRAVLDFKTAANFNIWNDIAHMSPQLKTYMLLDKMTAQRDGDDVASTADLPAAAQGQARAASAATVLRGHVRLAQRLHAAVLLDAVGRCAPRNLRCSHCARVGGRPDGRRARERHPRLPVGVPLLRHLPAVRRWLERGVGARRQIRDSRSIRLLRRQGPGRQMTEITQQDQAEGIARTLSMLIHGPSKAGKSTLAATSPGPRLLLDAEHGHKFLDLKIRYWDPHQDPPELDGTWDTCVVVVRNYDDVLQVYRWLQSGRHPFKSLIMDSITEIQAKCVDQLAGREQMKTQQWGELLRHMNGLMRDIRDLTMHPTNPLSAVVITAMTVQKDGKWRPYLQGQSGTTAPYFWDITGYIQAEEFQHPDPRRATTWSGVSTSARTTTMSVESESVEGSGTSSNRLTSTSRSCWTVSTREERDSNGRHHSRCAVRRARTRLGAVARRRRRQLRRSYGYHQEVSERQGHDQHPVRC